MSVTVSTDPVASIAARVVTRTASPLNGCVIPTWWEALFHSSPNRSIFLSTAWMQSWLDVYHADFRGLWVRWEHDGVIVGGCLLLTRTTWRRGVPMRTLFFNATGEMSSRTPLAEFNDVLHVSGYAQAILADLSRTVQSMRWSLLRVSGYQRPSLLERLVTSVRAGSITCQTQPAPYVDLTVIRSVYLNSICGRGGSQIRRQVRLYEQRRGPVAATRASTLEQALQFFDELQRLHQAHWRSKGLSGSFSTEGLVRFHRALIVRLWRQQAVDLIRVGSDRVVAGYVYNFISDAKVYFFQSGFDYQQDGKLSPGIVTHCLAIEHYRQRGMHEYDFLAGDMQYKRTLANASRDLCWSTVYRDRVWLRMALWLHLKLGGLTKAGSILLFVDWPVPPTLTTQWFL